MENFHFYPTLTQEMISKCGLVSDDYKFKYKFQDDYIELEPKGRNVITLSDPKVDIWDVEEDGIIIEKNVWIKRPELLKGPSGVACRDAELGLCIIWTNRKLTQKGYIKPESDAEFSRDGKYKFRCEFKPGNLSGDLELSLILYIKKRAANVLPDEKNLINEDGVTVGEIEKVALDFKNIYMSFPIKECKSETEPLWWVEFFSSGKWEDPQNTDMFSEDSFCLYLNSNYKNCPLPTAERENSGIKNFDLLVDILAQTYLMIFQKLSEEDLKAADQRNDLNCETICGVLHQFIEDCDKNLHLWDLESNPEIVLKSLQVNIRKMLRRDFE